MNYRLIAYIPLLIAGAIQAGAQSKFDMGAAELAENYRQLNSQPISPLSTENDSYDRVGVLIVMNDADGITDLKTLGIDIMDFKGMVAVASVPISQLENAAALKSVRSISLGNPQNPQLYFARTMTMANGILDGTAEGISHPYTGAGVVTGLMDQGIDPNHVNFLNHDMTESRVKEVYYYQGKGGIAEKYITPQAIAEFTTDDKSTSHGTHTAGIMAGSYRGKGTFGLNGRVVEYGDFPYYGLAMNSDIVMGAGTLYDANISSCVGNIITYANKVGKPAVVNLSLGMVVGPHDGTSPLSQYLEAAGKEAVICVAAGNDGTNKVSLSRNFNALNKTLRTSITQTDFNAAQTAEFWNSSEKEFKVEFGLYDVTTSEILGSYVLETNGKTISLPDQDASLKDIFRAAYSNRSYVSLYGNVDPNNDRYYVKLVYYLERTAASNNAIVPMIKITGNAGDKVSGFTAGGEFLSAGVPGWLNGSSSGSISDMATGKNIIAVGAFTSSETFTTLEGSKLQYLDASKTGDIASFTSYGYNYEGTPLPDLCGPGTAIVSSYNLYNTGADPLPSKVSGKVTYDNRVNYWGAMQGTSMACPYIAGTVALMIEADNTLTVADAKDILMSTAIAPPSSATSDEKLQWGAGRVNVEAALKETLKRTSGIGRVFAEDDESLIVTAADGGYEVFVAGAAAISVSLVDMQGRTLASATADGDTAFLTTDGLIPGICVLTVQTPASRLSRKIAIR